MIDPPLVDPEEQVLLGGEVGVDRALGVARLLGDLVHRRGVKAARDEACLGRGQEVLAGLLASLHPGEPHWHTITIRIPRELKYYWYNDAVSIPLSRPKAWYALRLFAAGSPLLTWTTHSCAAVKPVGRRRILQECEYSDDAEATGAQPRCPAC